ncbi:MAG: hypothetical protein HY453_02350 [Parcubacteria group bacterium]|nr:hypothetical protein [Parcubacteria group bacterium]
MFVHKKSGREGKVRKKKIVIGKNWYAQKIDEGYILGPLKKSGSFVKIVPKAKFTKKRKLLKFLYSRHFKLEGIPENAELTTHEHCFKISPNAKKLKHFTLSPSWCAQLIDGIFHVGPLELPQNGTDHCKVNAVFSFSLENFDLKIAKENLIKIQIMDQEKFPHDWKNPIFFLKIIGKDEAKKTIKDEKKYRRKKKKAAQPKPKQKSKEWGRMQTKGKNKRGKK